MERSRYWIVFLLAWVAFSQSFASTKSDIYKAYIASSMVEWKVVIDRLQSTGIKDDASRLELVNYQYGYIGWCIGENRKDEANQYLELAEDNLNAIEKKQLYAAKVNSYRSAFYGFHIGLNMLLAPWYGSKSIACAKEAVALDSQDYLGYVQLGNVYFHAPSLMGGDKSKAIENYRIARMKLERASNEIIFDWNFLSLLVTTANCYESMGDLEKAKSSYEEILKIEPNFNWVRIELYPNILKKIKH